MPKDIISANAVDLLLSAKPANTDFELEENEIGDFKASVIGFIQAIYSGLTDYSGTFELWVSTVCEPNSFAKHPCSEIKVDSDCSSVSWNLSAIGFRFIKIKYVANGETTGTIDRIVAIGKKNGF